MRLFGKEDKEATDNPTGNAPAAKAKKKSLSLKQYFQRMLILATRFQTAIIVIAVLGVLGLTALRMFGYADPPADEVRMEENRTKFKRITLNEKSIQRIKQLSDSQVSTSTNIPQNRNNPFAE